MDAETVETDVGTVEEKINEMMQKIALVISREIRAKNIGRLLSN